MDSADASARDQSASSSDDDMYHDALSGDTDSVTETLGVAAYDIHVVKLVRGVWSRASHASTKGRDAGDGAAATSTSGVPGVPGVPGGSATDKLRAFVTKTTGTENIGRRPSRRSLAAVIGCVLTNHAEALEEDHSLDPGRQQYTEAIEALLPNGKPPDAVMLWVEKRHFRVGQSDAQMQQQIRNAVYVRHTPSFCRLANSP